MTVAELTDVIGLLKALPPAEWTEWHTTIYKLGIGDMDHAQVMRAMPALLKRCRFRPLPADIVEAVEDLMPVAPPANYVPTEEDKDIARRLGYGPRSD